MADEKQAAEAVNKFGNWWFVVGGVKCERDEYFADISRPGGSHTMSVETFLRALIRDLAWNFFYGMVNFDHVFGTTNHYGNVDVFAGLYNAGYRSQNKHYVENFKSEDALTVFRALMEDWTNDGFDPFPAPAETSPAFGPHSGDNRQAINRKRLTAKRMVGMKDDIPMRSDATGNKVQR